MPKNQTTKLPKMPADVGFSLGFFCGTVLGALGVYMLVTPEGKQLKQTIIEEFKLHQQNLILDTIKPDDEATHEEQPLIRSLRALVARVRTYIADSPAKPLSKPSSIRPHAPHRKHYFKQK